MSSLSVISLATNGYLKYWKELVLSAENRLFNDEVITFHIFTDSEIEAQDFVSDLDFAKFCIHPIPNLKWPEATLHRYKYIFENAKHFQDDYLIYLDADMKVISKTPSKVVDVFSKDLMTLVKHPGYWRPSGFNLFSFYVNNPFRFLSDILLKVRLGGLGAWDCNRESKAYVPRKLRNEYLCGGTWGGPRKLVTKMCFLLMEDIEDNERRGILARWHDESHLNKWATVNEFHALGPEYCFEPTFSNLRDVSGLIEAVSKDLAVQQAKRGE